MSSTSSAMAASTAHRDEGFLAVCNRQGERYDLTATQLARVLADHRTLRLVVLNACEGAQGSDYDIFSSAAATLVRRGFPLSLPCSTKSPTRPPSSFRTALRRSRRGPTGRYRRYRSAQVRELAINNTLEWGIPVLFMQAPDGVLFEVMEGVTREGGQGSGRKLGCGGQGKVGRQPRSQTPSRRAEPVRRSCK